MCVRPLANVRILVIDDDLHSLKLYQAILERAGCKTRVAASAEDALDILKYFKADVVITDVRLPGMNGLQLARSLKSQDSARLRTVIVVTSEDEALLSGVAREIGCAAVLRKPINALTFADQVASLVGNSIEPNTPK